MSKESSKELVSKQGPLGPHERWSARRKGEAVLRLLRGEPVDTLSRELGVEIYRLEQWREKALLGIDEALREPTQVLGHYTMLRVPGTAPDQRRGRTVFPDTQRTGDLRQDLSDDCGSPPSRQGIRGTIQPAMARREEPRDH